MTAVAFDTLKFARALRDRAHMSAEHAEGPSEVFAEAVQGGLPTRADLQSLEGSVKAELVAVRSEIAAFQAETRSEFAAVRADLAAFKTETRNEFAAVRSETEAEFAAVRQEMKTEFAAVRSEMAAFKSDTKNEFASVRSEMKLLEQRMTIKLGAMLVALGGILIAAIRYMPAR
ncbi:hypothetical protein DK419_01035 [Methylobacterium terrae]|uniref:DUF1640 domain-containing protein n=1 Tax=Methylobacterium terrae TaxID=2202827 RepID=A0A2U8WGB2_9HYPH|nr:coiled-coil domain-containing protein [Methylobacterium terrae]AWN45089.1 hypothetical protein DK419_01035 [Methylobacterium terrae]